MHFLHSRHSHQQWRYFENPRTLCNLLGCIIGKIIKFVDETKENLKEITLFQCVQKVLGYLKKRQQILSLFFCIRKICRQIVCGGNHADVLKSDLRKTLTFLKMFAVGVTSSLGLFVACPIKLYFVDNELMSLLPIEIIFVDQSTGFSGFAIANAVMTVMGIFAALGTILYGAVFIFAIRMYSLQINLIGQDFKDLDEMWAEGSTVSLRHKQSFLKNICNKRQDIRK